MGKQTVQPVSYYGTQQVAAPPARLNDTEDRRRPIKVKRTTQSLWSAKGSPDIFHRGGQMGQNAHQNQRAQVNFRNSLSLLYVGWLKIMRESPTDVLWFLVL